MLPPAVMLVVGSGIDSHPGDVGVVEVASTDGFHAGWFDHVVVASSHASLCGMDLTHHRYRARRSSRGAASRR